MGLFGAKYNSKTAFETTNQLVYLFARDKIKLNTILNIEANQVAYVMVKDKITDEFLPGSYTLSVATLPITARALNLHKQTNKTKQIIRKIEADLYIISKENFNIENVNSFRFVVRDAKWSRVEASVNFSCSLKVINPVDFLLSLRKFVAVVNKNRAEKLLVDFSKDLICETIQKLNIQIESFMKQPEEVCKQIFEKFVEKMQKLGIGVIDFNMNKINLPKRLREAFGKDIQTTPFEETVKTMTDMTNSQLVLERVGLQGKGDRSVDATLISGTKETQTSELLNIDAFSQVQNKPSRDLKINFDFNTQNNSGESISSSLQNNSIFADTYEEKTGNINQNVFTNSASSDRMNEEQAEKRFCSKCGKLLNQDDVFCSRCGNRVK